MSLEKVVVHITTDEDCMLNEINDTTYYGIL